MYPAVTRDRAIHRTGGSAGATHPDRALGVVGVDDPPALCDLGAPGGHEPPGRRARGLHELAPVVGADLAGGLARADRRVARPGVEQRLEGVLQLEVDLGQAVLAAAVGAPAHRVPVALPRLAPGDGATAPVARFGGQRGAGHVPQSASPWPLDGSQGAERGLSTAYEARNVASRRVGGHGMWPFDGGGSGGLTDLFVGDVGDGRVEEADDVV